MTTALVVLAGIGWIGCGPFLAWFMRSRGHDAVSWLVVGSLIGPAALALALTERLTWTQPVPELVVRGTSKGGVVNILVLTDHRADVVSVVMPLIEWFGACVGRTTVARVLPEGGPRAEQARSTRAIKQLVHQIAPGSAEGILLFGGTESAVAALVRDEHFHVAVTAEPDRAVTRALVGTDVLHVDGPRYVHDLTAARPRRDRGLHRTSSNWVTR